MLRTLLRLLRCLLRRPPARRPTSYLALGSTPMAPAPAPDPHTRAVQHLHRCWALDPACHHNPPHP